MENHINSFNLFTLILSHSLDNYKTGTVYINFVETILFKFPVSVSEEICLGLFFNEFIEMVYSFNGCTSDNTQ